MHMDEASRANPIMSADCLGGKRGLKRDNDNIYNRFQETVSSA